MNRTLALSSLVFMVGYYPATAQDGKKPAQRATVVFAAPMTGFALVGEKEDRHELRLQGGRDPIADAVYVDVRAKVSPGAGASRQVVGVEGTLRMKKVAIGAAGKSEITTGAISIEASKAAIVKDANKEQFPPSGKTWIVGKLVKGKFALDKGEPVAWAIVDGDNHILLSGKVADLEPGVRVRAEGVLRTVGSAGFQLTLDRLEPMK